MTEKRQDRSTAMLLGLIQQGDVQARDELFRRCLPLLRRFAHGRLPHFRRDLSETDDLVQVTLLRALNRLDSFESEGRGAFFGYLRTIMMNAVRDEIRKHGRKPQSTDSWDKGIQTGDSVVEQAVGLETLEAYEAALSTIRQESREAIILHVEFDMSYAEVALELELSSSDAARMRIKRGLKELATQMP